MTVLGDIWRRSEALNALVAQYGVRRCAFRFWHDFRRHRGWLDGKYRPWSWEDRLLKSWLKPGVPHTPDAYYRFRLENTRPFFFPPGALPEIPPGWATGAVSAAEQLLQGRFQFFGSLESGLGYPSPRWFENPFTNQRTDNATHWLHRNDFDRRSGDIKFIWEPSRFMWVYDLARAYAVTGDDRFAEAFWTLCDDWMSANPPEMGPNWQCGQEISIRMLAVVFGLHAFMLSPKTSPGMVSRAVVLLAGSAERVAKNIDYARAQMGNHATSEAAALYVVGSLFPELASAEDWRELGRHVLLDESAKFHWPDGTYVQHSVNYQRLMLDAYLWAGRIGVLNGAPLPALVTDNLEKSWRFLYQIQDSSTGRVPNYGPNDGAQAFPLHGCGYLDYRPIINAMSRLTCGANCYEPGPWLEKSVWTSGPDGPETPRLDQERRSHSFPTGGYYTLRGRESWALFRCHTYRNRPNQADMLHLDIWWKGWNVARDSGTYSYFDPDQGFHSYFVSTAAHNTVRVGNTEQMRKGPRFRWHSLLNSRLEKVMLGGACEIVAGSHDGYKRLASRSVHRRTVCRLPDDGWIIVDDILGSGIEVAELFWHFSDVPLTRDGSCLELAGAPGKAHVHVLSNAPDVALSVARGQTAPVKSGWDSLHYGTKVPAPTLTAAVESELPVRFVTVFSFDHEMSLERTDVESELRWSADRSTVRVLFSRPCSDEAAIREIRIGNRDMLSPGIHRK